MLDWEALIKAFGVVIVIVLLMLGVAWLLEWITETYGGEAAFMSFFGLLILFGAGAASYISFKNNNDRTRILRGHRENAGVGIETRRRDY